MSNSWSDSRFAGLGLAKHLIASCALLAVSIAPFVACGTGAAPNPIGDSPSTSVVGDAGPSPSSSGSQSTGDPGIATDAIVVFSTPVPTGGLCVVASTTGSTSQTVSTALTAGSSSGTITFGALKAGLITVNANAYAGGCPASGPATWVGDPVQITVIAGVPTKISLNLHPTSTGTGTVTLSQPAISIAVGSATSYAVLADGTVRAWGSNANGEFGAPMGTLHADAGAPSLTPVTVEGVTNAVQIGAGTDFACVVRDDNSVVCWGDCGLSRSFGFSCVPYPATGPAVAPGLSATHIYSGTAALAYLGMGGAFGLSVAGSINWVPNVDAISATPGSMQDAAQACYVSNEGTAFCWAHSVQGYVQEATAAAQVFEGFESTSNPFGCALLVNGTVSCWGYNSSGQLGVGSTSTSPISPTVVPGLSNVVSMSLARNNSYSCAATQGGAVLCAGVNGSGQLGNGTANPTTAFTPVTGLTGVVELAAGQDHTCARRTDGSVACWGNNDSGQVGDGTNITRFTPVTVAAW